MVYPIDLAVVDNVFPVRIGVTIQDASDVESANFCTGRYCTISSHHSDGGHYPRVSLPISNEKVQVLPRFAPEPMEAGTSISPFGSLAIGPGARSGPWRHAAPTFVRSESVITTFACCHACHGENALLKRVAPICRYHLGQGSITGGGTKYGRDGRFEVCDRIEPRRGAKQSGGRMIET